MASCKYYKQQKYVSYDSGTTWSALNEFQPGELYESFSPDCPSTDLIYRWYPVENGYICEDKDLYRKEVYQYSTDGVNYMNVYPTTFRASGQPIEVNSEYCNNSYEGHYEVSGSTDCPHGYYWNDYIKKCVKADPIKIVKCQNESVTLTSADTKYYISSFTVPNKTGGTTTYFYILNGCTIGDCITTIGENAFQSCSGIKSIGNIGSGASIEIPNNVTTIAASAFTNCSGLTSINIPNSVTTIGNDVFKNCNSLSTATLGNGITTISNRLFSGCTSLVSCPIPSCVTSIGEQAFTNCYSLINISIPDSVTSIGGSAFTNCRSLNSVSIGSGVTEIGSSAFTNCSGLTGITVEAMTPPTLVDYAFNNTNDCPIYVHCNAVNDYKTASYWGYYGSRIRTIEECPYKLFTTYSDLSSNTVYCNSSTTLTWREVRDTTVPYTSMTSAEIGNCVTSIGEDAFQYCKSLSSCTISSGVTNIGNMAFFSATSLTSIDIPDSVTSIGASAFTYCSGLTNATIGSGVTSIGNNAFERCYSLTSINIPTGITNISEAAFRYCSGLTSIDIPDSVTSIGGGAFQYCRSLSSVTIPDNVTTIEPYAFYYCSGLTSITVESTTPPTIGSNGVFDYTNNCPIYVPAESVNTYKSATYWSAYASRIQAMPSKLLATYSDLSTYSVRCNDSTTLTAAEVTGGTGTTAITTAEIGSCVTSIDWFAFSGCSGLASVNIASGVTSIGLGAFKNCTNLTSINIPDGITNISHSVFSGCTSLTSIDIPDSVTSISMYAFEECSGLTSVEIPSGITSLGYRAFFNCRSLVSITCLATTPPELGGYTFELTNNCPIYVPAASVNAYKADEMWSFYANRIQAIT